MPTTVPGFPGTTEFRFNTDPSVAGQYDPTAPDAFQRWLALGQPTHDSQGRPLDVRGQPMGGIGPDGHSSYGYTFDDMYSSQPFTGNQMDPSQGNYTGDPNDFIAQFARGDFANNGQQHRQNWVGDILKSHAPSYLAGLLNIISPEDFSKYSVMDQRLIRQILSQYNYKPGWLLNESNANTPGADNPAGAATAAGQFSNYGTPPALQDAPNTATNPAGSTAPIMAGPPGPQGTSVANQFSAPKNLYSMSKALGNQANRSSPFGGSSGRSPFMGGTGPRGYKGYS